MQYQEAFALFEKMIAVAKQELLEFTLHQPFEKEQKADKSMVTDCDKMLDTKLSAMAWETGFQVLSEEGDHAEDILHSGNYFIIDPIDGTNRYINNINFALEQGSINRFLEKDLGSDHDFALLLGIVENGIPQYAAVYVYTTGEKILVDGNNKDNLVRENNVRNFTGKDVVYTHNEHVGQIEKTVSSLPDVTLISQSAYGIKSLYTLINPHENAMAPHKKNNMGLWDVMPAAVAARAFGGQVYDGQGKPLVCTEYVYIPPRGAIVVKGEKFLSMLDLLQDKSQEGI